MSDQSNECLGNPTLSTSIRVIRTLTILGLIWRNVPQHMLTQTSSLCTDRLLKLNGDLIGRMAKSSTWYHDNLIAW